MTKKKYAMVIDLQKCVGCGACGIACKTENNTQGRTGGQSFNWADFCINTSGEFPNVNYTNMPVLCNHCEKPKCVAVCPEPKALYKTEDGIVMFNQKYCIQCGKCFGPQGCPYSSVNTEKEKAKYTVISFNAVGKKTHQKFRDNSTLIPGCTTNGAELAKLTGALPPDKHEFKFKDKLKPEKGQKSRGKGKLADVRTEGWVDKCNFCIHRVRNGEDPYCVVSCPAGARIFGDKNNKGSKVSKLIKSHSVSRLKNNKGEMLAKGEKGTDPKVYYIRNYKKTV